MLKRISLLFGTIYCSIISYTHIDTVKGLWIIPVSFIVGIIIFYTLLFGSCYIIGLFIDLNKEYKTYPKFYFIVLDLVEEFILDLCRVKLVVTNDDIVPKDQKYLVVFNHRSLADPVIISHALKRDRVIHISKPENFKAFIAGKFIYRCGYLPINRDNDREALKTILKCINYLKKQTFSVGVSPEGTRNKISDNNMLPFKPGMFKIAMKSNSPIVVSTIRNSFDIHRNFPFRNTKIELRIVKVLYPEDYQNMNTFEISDMVRTIMNNDLGFVDDIKNIESNQVEKED